MGYLNNASVTVDAILTNKGRELLAAGGALNITKFALSDDEIDYDLWNPAHTLGTNYYGAVIENMPVLEALPDETQMMRYKLVTLPKDIAGIPVISVTPSTVTITSRQQVATVQPITVNMVGANNTLGYTAILSDNTVCELAVASGGEVSGIAAIASGLTGMGSMTANNFLDDENTSVTTAGTSVIKVGTKFTLMAKNQPDVTKNRYALLSIIGNETGGFKTIQITITPQTFAVQDVQLDMNNIGQAPNQGPISYTQ